MRHTMIVPETIESNADGTVKTAGINSKLQGKLSVTAKSPANASCAATSNIKYKLNAKRKT
jgi:hypothetical protein